MSRALSERALTSPGPWAHKRNSSSGAYAVISLAEGRQHRRHLATVYGTARDAAAMAAAPQLEVALENALALVARLKSASPPAPNDAQAAHVEATGRQLLQRLNEVSS